MRKRNFLTLCVFALSLACIACAQAPKFELSAQTAQRTVARGESFTVTVQTKNVGGKFSYTGSSTKVGATAYLSHAETGAQLESKPITVNLDMVAMEVARGEVISCEWTFNTNTESEKGAYALTLTYQEQTVTLADFITLI